MNYKSIVDELGFTPEPVFASVHTEMIFPKTIRVYTFNRKFTDEEMALISVERNNPRRNGNQSNYLSESNRVLDRPGLSQLKATIQEALNDYLREILKAKNDTSLYITQSWINYTYGGQWHHPHTHPNSFLSGVLYFKTNPADRIVFENVREFAFLRIEPTEYTVHNSDNWSISARVGDLLIFPSTLAHSVPIKTTDDERISLSFNTFIRGKLGEDLNLTGLELR